MVDDARAEVNAVGWTLGAISTVIIALRIYARTVLASKFGWDDGLMVLAWALSIVTTAMVTVGTQHGFGTHQDLILNKHDQEEAVKYTLIPSGVTLFASAAAKISVAVFLFRLLGRAAKLHHKIILYGASIVMLGANSVSWTFLFGYCDPREKAWKPELDGTCRSGETLDITARVVSGYNAFMDLLCAAFAVMLVCSLNMKTSTKLGLAVLMGGGIFGAAATIAKIIVMGNIKNTPDMTWSWTPIAYWYLAEMHVLVIAGSIPMLRPVISKVRGKEYGSYNQGGSTGPGYKQYGYRLGGTNNSNKSGNAPGLHTVALRDLDNDDDGHGHQTDIDGRRSNEAGSSGGSSVENILPKQHPPAKTQEFDGYGRDKGIQVTNEVKVGYS